MNRKIVSIFMTIFMLLLCVSLSIVFRYVQSIGARDLSHARAANSVLSVGIHDAHEADAFAVWTGASVKAMVQRAASIDSILLEIQFADRPIYDLQRDFITGGYEVWFNGILVSVANVNTLFNDTSEYRLTYEFAGDSTVITITQN
jgi:hypothetical protein